MEKIIYVKLVGEGTIVYRPVPAMKINSRIYRILCSDIYDPDDEVWEFVPNTLVLVEEKETSDGNILLAVRKAEC